MELDRRVRLSKCSMSDAEAEQVARVLKSEYLGMGEEVHLFEDEIKEFLKTEKDVICVNTGTAALHLALSALGIGPGDEVLVPSLTYVASFQAISAVGAKPIACDVLEDTVFLDVEDARKRVTKKTKAIMPVHYASACTGLENVYRLAEEYQLRVVEDAAQSFGCKVGDSWVGQNGDILCFSFDGIKNITCGEGGAILTSDPEVAQRAKDGRLLSVMKDTEKRYKGERSWNFDVQSQGYRFHMSNIMAAIGRVQLKRSPEFFSKRVSFSHLYEELLSEVNGVSLLSFSQKERVPHIFPIKVKKELRQNLMLYLRGRGVEVGFHYTPNHLLSFFKTDYSLPVTEKLAQELVTLPLHVDLQNEDIYYVVEVIKEFMTKERV